MAKASASAKRLIELRVRDWRLVRRDLNRLKPALVEGKKLEEAERAARAEVGGLIHVDKAQLVVDGALVIYERAERAGGFDYEGAWKAMYDAAADVLRKKMSELLQAKPPVTLHKLTDTQE